jgi:secondary thiamine-phosphate synthase enzyme
VKAVAALLARVRNEGRSQRRQSQIQAFLRTLSWIRPGNLLAPHHRLAARFDRLNASQQSLFVESNSTMAWFQRTLELPPQRRGFHLITDRVVAALDELQRIEIGLLHVFIQHTSASLTINENADPDVPADLETSFNSIAPEDPREFEYTHTVEGPDDMPAHVKAAMLGSSVTIPVRSGRLLLGTWQGIYLCEHRNRATARRLVLTLQGQTRT